LQLQVGACAKPEPAIPSTIEMTIKYICCTRLPENPTKPRNRNTADSPDRFNAPVALRDRCRAQTRLDSNFCEKIQRKKFGRNEPETSRKKVNRVNKPLIKLKYRY
jgi:hypothetical protein